MQVALDIREEVHRLADALPDEATWDDVMREIECRKSVQQGKADVVAGRVKSHEQIKQKWEVRLAAQLDQQSGK